MNENKRLIKNTGIIAVGSLSTKIVSFLLLPLYTALLSSSEYGTFDYIYSIAVFSLPFLTFLMEESIFRFLLDCKTDKEKQEVDIKKLCILLACLNGSGLFYCT